MKPFVELCNFPKHLPLSALIAHGGQDFRVMARLHYQLRDRVRVLYRLTGSSGTPYLEPMLDEPGERALWLTEIPRLDIDTPPPRIIDWQGRSYLQTWGGPATVCSEGDAKPNHPWTGWVWRFRTAGDEYLQIERNEAGIRMLAGPSVHWSMIEARPET